MDDHSDPAWRSQTIHALIQYEEYSVNHEKDPKSRKTDCVYTTHCFRNPIIPTIHSLEWSYIAENPDTKQHIVRSRYITFRNRITHLSFALNNEKKDE